MLRKLYWAVRSALASPPAPTPQYHSRFGGLWTDRRDALAELDRRAAAHPEVAALRDKLAFFIDNGYVILEGAVDPAAIDAYKSDLLTAAQTNSTPLVARLCLMRSAWCRSATTVTPGRSMPGRGGRTGWPPVPSTSVS